MSMSTRAWMVKRLVNKQLGSHVKHKRVQDSTSFCVIVLSSSSVQQSFMPPARHSDDSSSSDASPKTDWPEFQKLGRIRGFQCLRSALAGGLGLPASHWPCRYAQGLRLPTDQIRGQDSTPNSPTPSLGVNPLLGNHLSAKSPNVHSEQPLPDAFNCGKELPLNYRRLGGGNGVKELWSSIPGKQASHITSLSLVCRKSERRLRNTADTVRECLGPFTPRPPGRPTV
jgi:hypothetical protein